MNSKELIEAFYDIAAVIEWEKDYLTELDNVIADGDHGINLDRGFKSVEAKLPELTGMAPSKIFQTVAMTLLSTVGGAAGPLYGTGFMRMGASVQNKDEIFTSDFIDALKAAIDGISARGRSQYGEKTMLDSMIPAYDAMKDAFESGKTDKEIWNLGIKAAEEGIEFTKTISASKGRASYIGERSIGHQDPGATSFTLMLKTVGEKIS